MISPVSQHSDELTMSQELAVGNITKMDLGTGGGSECWKFTLAQHNTAPAAPASQLFAQSSDYSCWNTPGAEVSTSRDPQKKYSSSTSVLYCGKWPQNCSCPLSGHLPARQGQVRLAGPSFHYTPRIVLPLVLLPHAEHHRRGQLQSSGFTAPAVLYFKL